MCIRDRIKYLLNMQRSEIPIFLLSRKGLVNFAQPAVFVATRSIFMTIPLETRNLFRVVRVGKIGHTKVVVFVRKRRSVNELNLTTPATE